MTTSNPAGKPITLTASSAADLTRVLTVLDEFLRSGQPVIDELATFMSHRGSGYPGYDARLLVDEASFAAAYLQRLTTPPSVHNDS